MKSQKSLLGVQKMNFYLGFSVVTAGCQVERWTLRANFEGLQLSHDSARGDEILVMGAIVGMWCFCYWRWARCRWARSRWTRWIGLFRIWARIFRDFLFTRSWFLFSSLAGLLHGWKIRFLLCTRAMLFLTARSLLSCPASRCRRHFETMQISVFLGDHNFDLFRQSWEWAALSGTHDKGG